MIDVSTIRKFSEKAHFPLLIPIVVTLPTTSTAAINSFFMLLLIFNWILLFRLPKITKSTFFFGLFYFFYVVGILWSSNVQQGFFELEKKIGLVVFLLVLSNSPPPSNRQFRIILVAFVASCYVASFICLAKAFQLYAEAPSSTHFFYYPLVDIIGIHPIYLALYIAFSAFILIFEFTPSKATKPVLKILYVLAILYLVCFLFLLSARAEIIAFYLIAIVTVLVYGFRHKKLAMAVATLFTLLVCFLVLVLLNPVNRERFKEAINYKGEYGIERHWGGRAERFLMWECATDIIKEQPLVGVGPGDVIDELENCYRVKQFTPLVFYPNVHYNCHNQYLETMLDLGIGGVALLIIILITMAIHAVKYNDYLFQAFIALFALACLTESMLEVNKGIVFFSLFSALFINAVRNNPPRTIKS